MPYKDKFDKMGEVISRGTVIYTNATAQATALEQGEVKLTVQPGERLILYKDAIYIVRRASPQTRGEGGK